MDLEFFSLLSTRSQRAIRRKRSRWGKAYLYTPRESLVERLHLRTGKPKDYVRDQLRKEHRYLKELSAGIAL